jgi:hypothetical protein
MATVIVPVVVQEELSGVPALYNTAKIVQQGVRCVGFYCFSPESCCGWDVCDWNNWVPICHPNYRLSVVLCIVRGRYS